MKQIKIGLAAVMVTLWASFSWAEMVSLRFSGTISSSSLAGISAGNTFSYLLQYDDATADASGGVDPTRAFYNGAAAAASLSINGALFTSGTSGGIEIYNNVSGVDCWRESAYFSGSGYSILINLLDFSQTALNSNALVVPVLTAFPDQRAFSISLGELSSAQGTITSIAAVPEPASVMMVGVGGLLIAVYRRARKAYGM